jgi:hypothetical protein
MTTKKGSLKCVASNGIATKDISAKRDEKLREFLSFLNDEEIGTFFCYSLLSLKKSMEWKRGKLLKLKMKKVVLN